MKSERRPKARQYIDGLLSGSRYSFSTTEARVALGLSPAALKAALSRLVHKKLIVSPVRGFYIIVPPEYRALGSLPAEQFIPSLMQWLDEPYYAGLLTAAQYHGAAHQRPQEFQVFVGGARRALTVGRVRVAFIVRKDIRKVPVQSLNTPRGTLLVSTPEATAFDLVGYQHHAGGLNQVATVLAELAEKIDPAALAKVAPTAPISWAQRLGYLLERIDAGEKTAPLKSYVQKHTHESTLLLPRARQKKTRRDSEWKLYVNADVEPDL